MGRNDSCVVNDLLFPHPPGVRLLHKQIDRITRGICLQSKFDGLVVFDELPQAVRRYNDKFVRFGIEFALGELRVGDDAGCVCYGVSERPADIIRMRRSRFVRNTLKTRIPCNRSRSKETDAAVNKFA